MYLPQHMIPNLETIDFDELFEVVAKANCAKKMRVDDIKNGMIQAANEIYSE